MIRQLLILFFLLPTTLGAWAQKPLTDISKLRPLDLLFVVADKPNAITEVTSGPAGYMAEHVGVVIEEGGEKKVVEAVYEGVRETSLSQFFSTGQTIIVGRLTRTVDKRQTLQNLRSHLGKPYDFVYQPGDEAIYCSELVSESFVDRTGAKLFPPTSMSFHDVSGQVLPYWTDFYSRRGMDVPEGLPGTNPEELLRRDAVRMKYVVGHFVK